MTLPCFVVPDERAAVGWQARLRLTLERRGDRSVLAGVDHEGPLRLQRPFHPEGRDHPHLYVLHPPGGLVGGDQLAMTVTAKAGAGALITTPATTKVYDAGAGASVQSQHVVLRVAAGARLEWLPMDTLLFSGARYRSTTVVELEGDACACLWEVTTLGRAAGHHPFVSGDVRQRLEIRRDGRLVWREQAALTADDRLRASPYGWGGHDVWGSVIVTLCPSRVLLDALRDAAAAFEDGRASVTVVRGLTVARYLGNDAAAALRWFMQVWAMTREIALERQPCAPRIWAT